LQDGFFKGVFNYFLTESTAAPATESTVSVAAVAAESIVSVAAVADESIESEALLSDLLVLQAATDNEIAKAKKPNLNKFFILMLL
jgi:hypothetical protein